MKRSAASRSSPALTIGLGMAICSCCAAQSPAEQLTVTPGLYSITAQTVLPHLEENLRDAITRTQQCLGTQSAASLFPLLHHEAFSGCTLSGHQVRDGAHVYALVCKNREAASGQATFIASDSQLQGVLDVKMGGKNMTLSQRVRAQRLEACK